MNRPLAVVAVGGNALIGDSEHLSLQDQAAQARITCDHIAPLLVDGWRVVLTHGNGPQVGFILHRSELAKVSAPEVPLVYAVADTQGAIGFMMQQGMTNALARHRLPTDAVTVVTRVVVDKDDPAFTHPSKPIGAHYDEATARSLADQFGWQIMEDSGRGWRRTVASPFPRRIVELEAIRHLVERGDMVIAAGGGGIPVIERPGGGLDPIDAVIDKDATSALLAMDLDADALVILTDVPQVAINFGTPQQAGLAELTVDRARAYAADGQFGTGSMGPKVDAGVAFATARPEGRAVITNASSLVHALTGDGGTRIVASSASATRSSRPAALE